MSDGRNILSGISVILNDNYIRLPNMFLGNAINVNTKAEKSVVDNTCGSGRQCEDFMMSGSLSRKGSKLKTILENLNYECVSIPVSGAGLKLNLTKLINVMSDELRIKDNESNVLELITIAAEESGYGFTMHINNQNQFEVLPINYKFQTKEKSLFSFIANLTADDIVISKNYGEEIAGSSAKNKRVVFGDNISYLTTVRDYSYQTMCEPQINFDNGICCLAEGGIAQVTYEQCLTIEGATWSLYAVDELDRITDDGLCETRLQPHCSIRNSPGSIGAYDAFFVTPTPYPSDCNP